MLPYYIRMDIFESDKFGGGALLNGNLTRWKYIEVYGKLLILSKNTPG